MITKHSQAGVGVLGDSTLFTLHGVPVERFETIKGPLHGL
jgi:hypothetical protein